MNSLLPVLQAIAADQASAVRMLDLGVVTEVFRNESGSGDVHPAVNVRVRGSSLELSRVPVTVGRIGMSVVPRVGDLVVIGYPGGSLDGAVVLGSLYDDQNVPPEATPQEIVYQVPDAGQDGVRRVEIVVDTDKTITVEEGKVDVVMGSTSLTIEADGSVVVVAAGDISLTSGGDIVLDAQGDIRVSGINVAVEAQASADIKGTASASLEASGTTKVKGGIVTVGGVVQFSAG
jgi:phage baseplate assembly protein gpV